MSVFLHLSMTAATGDIQISDEMAFAAVGFEELISDVYRVYEVLRLAPCRNVLLSLA